MNLRFGFGMAAFGFLMGGVALAADSDAVVARAGERTITAAAATARMQHTPPAQLKGLVQGGESVPRAVVERWLVPELLASLEAERRGLEKSPRVADRIREVLRQALEKTLEKETLAASPVTDAQIREYFEANRGKYEQPARIRIWRILVGDEASAKAVIAQAKAENRPAKWSDLAREKSLDKATSMRQGDLGFVRADGSTDVPRVQVDPELYKAASGIKDGDLLERPVAEGDKFAVLWRRGSLTASKRTLEAEAPSIRQMLERQRGDQALTALRDKLRGERVSAEKPELLDGLPPALFGAPATRPLPGPARRAPAPSKSGAPAEKK